MDASLLAGAGTSNVPTPLSSLAKPPGVSKFKRAVISDSDTDDEEVGLIGNIQKQSNATTAPSSVVAIAGTQEEGAGEKAAKPRRKMKKATACRCGSTTHFRTSSLACPLNKKNIKPETMSTATPSTTTAADGNTVPTKAPLFSDAYVPTGGLERALLDTCSSPVPAPAAARVAGSPTSTPASPLLLPHTPADVKGVAAPPAVPALVCPPSAESAAEKEGAVLPSPAGRPAPWPAAFVLTIKNGTPWIVPNCSTIGVFRTKEEAMANAMELLNTHSCGDLLNCMGLDEEDGVTFVDNRKRCPDNGIVMHSTDAEGSWETLEITNLAAAGGGGNDNAESAEESETDSETDSCHSETETDEDGGVDVADGEWLRGHIKVNLHDKEAPFICMVCRGEIPRCPVNPDHLTDKLSSCTDSFTQVECNSIVSHKADCARKLHDKATARMPHAAAYHARLGTRVFAEGDYKGSTYASVRLKDPFCAYFGGVNRSLAIPEQKEAAEYAQAIGAFECMVAREEDASAFILYDEIVKEVEALKITGLKSLLRELGETVGGNKGALVYRLIAPGAGSKLFKRRRKEQMFDKAVAEEWGMEKMIAQFGFHKALEHWTQTKDLAGNEPCFLSVEMAMDSSGSPTGYAAQTASVAVAELSTYLSRPVRAYERPPYVLLQDSTCHRDHADYTGPFDYVCSLVETKLVQARGCSLSISFAFDEGDSRVLNAYDDSDTRYSVGIMPQVAFIVASNASEETEAAVNRMRAELHAQWVVLNSASRGRDEIERRKEEEQEEAEEARLEAEEALLRLKQEMQYKEDALVVQKIATSPLVDESAADIHQDAIADCTPWDVRGAWRIVSPAIEKLTTEHGSHRWIDCKDTESVNYKLALSGGDGVKEMMGSFDFHAYFGWLKLNCASVTADSPTATFSWRGRSGMDRYNYDGYDFHGDNSIEDNFDDCTGEITFVENGTRCWGFIKGGEMHKSHFSGWLYGNGGQEEEGAEQAATEEVETEAEEEEAEEEEAKEEAQGYIVGLTQDTLDGMRGSYNECGTPTPEETEQEEGWTKYAWTVEGTVGFYDIHVSVPDNWGDVGNGSGDLQIECSCPDAERQAQKNSRTRQAECPQYCKHVYKCLSGLVESEGGLDEEDGDESKRVLVPKKLPKLVRVEKDGGHRATVAAPPLYYTGETAVYTAGDEDSLMELHYQYLNIERSVQERHCRRRWERW